MRSALLVALLALIGPNLASYIESVAANVDDSRRHDKFVPLVAFQCGFRNKWMSPDGTWTTDEDRYATCMIGKLDILKYCRRAYPKLNVTNIVEYSHEVKIEDWCKEEGSPCKWTHTVRPYQCIVGQFHSEALQVPHNCRFAHVSSREPCDDYEHWKREAGRQCAAKAFEGKKMEVRSFAVLEPCGLDMFSGVEFVCCPSDEKAVPLAKDGEKTETKKKEEKSDEDDDDDYDDDDENDEESEETEKQLEQDPYFKQIDPANEHENYKDAAERLEKKHRERVDKVMKEWAELEERYEQMSKKDSKGAEAFKTEMTNRFQKTVASLEEENRAAKRQLETTHEERVQAAINEKKRQATHDYRQALALHVGAANKHNVLKTLKAYIRAEEKDRMHMLNRYRHLLRTDQSEATVYQPVLLHRLRYIDIRINSTFAMLRDFPDLEKQVRPIALDFWTDYRHENTPEVTNPEVARLTDGHDDNSNRRLIEIYKETYERQHGIKMDAVAVPLSSTPTTTTTAKKAESSEEDDDEYYEDEDDEEVKKEDKKPKIKVVDIIKPPEKKILRPIVKPAEKVEKATQTDSDSESDEDSDEDEEDEKNVKELRVNIEPIIEEKPRVPDLRESPSFIRHEKLVHREEQVPFVGQQQTLWLAAGALLASLIVFAVVSMRRRARHQGFIEVDVCTPEERHVSGMQVNGYENPTYSFFDSKA